MASFGGSIKLTGADEYKNALKQITQSLRETGSELTAVASRYDANDKSLSTLNKKTSEMSDVLEKQKKAYDDLKTAYESFSSKVSSQAQEHNKLVQTYEAEKKKLDEIKQTSGETSKEYQDQQAKVTELANAVAKSSQNMNDNEVALSKMRTQLNQAETTVNKTTKEIDELGNETEESGEKAKKGAEGYTVFKNILANLGTQAINSALNGLKSLGSAFISVGKEAVSSYAEFEQLEGGVKKLFGDETAQIVMDNANKAFQSAGMSANEYMETVTGFSAAMINSLNGDTKEAARISDIAIQDMSDNANTFGTDMASIQNAYQGFAKGNFTMLDNLKLGFSGSKEGMQLLLDKAGELSGKKFDISNFADITEAIHIMQEEMNIAGTTSKEASTTIEGSTRSMKASWQNLLTGIASGNADIGKLVKDLVDNITTVALNILPIVRNVIEGAGELVNQLLGGEFFPELLSLLVDSISELLPDLLATVNTVISSLISVLPQFSEALSTLIPDVVNMLLSMTPQLLSVGIQVILNLIRGISQSIPQLLAMLPSIIVEIVNTLISNIGDIISCGVDLLLALITGLSEAIPQLVDMLPSIVETIVSTLIDNLPLLVDCAIQLMVAIITGLVQSLPKLATMVPRIIMTIVTTLISKLPEIITMGTKVIDSLIKGIGQLLGKLGTEAGKIMTTVINGIKELPSKVLDIGKNLVKGLWEGIHNMTDWVIGKIKGFGDKVLGGIKKFFGIKSPSSLFRDEVGKQLAAGVGVGFEDEMANVTKDMQNAIPTSFDTDLNVNSGISSNSFSYDYMLDAFKEALSDMKIELDDEVAGKFVERTVARAIYN